MEVRDQLNNLDLESIADESDFGDQSTTRNSQGIQKGVRLTVRQSGGERDPQLLNEPRRRHRNKEEENAHKIREAFYILTQGVDIMHYQEGSSRRRAPEKVRQVLWLEPEILRVCVDRRRLTATDQMSGKKAKGLYLRDLAEIRSGSATYQFKNAVRKPENDNHCLALIGTECTLSLEFPDQETRDWFLERLKLVLDDVLTMDEINERNQRNSKTGLVSALSSDETAAAQQLMALLQRGIQILHHNKAGKVLRSSVYYDADTQCLSVKATDSSFFSFFGNIGMGQQQQNLSLHMSDIAEIRPGSHSYGFVGTDSTDKGAECMSIVGTECVLDLQLATSNARDLFAQKLRIFKRYWDLNIAEDRDFDSGSDQGEGKETRDRYENGSNDAEVGNDGVGAGDNESIVVGSVAGSVQSSLFGERKSVAQSLREDSTQG
jgi:hypothetical protein